MLINRVTLINLNLQQLREIIRGYFESERANLTFHKPNALFVLRFSFLPTLLGTGNISQPWISVEVGNCNSSWYCSREAVGGAQTQEIAKFFLFFVNVFVCVFISGCYLHPLYRVIVSLCIIHFNRFDFDSLSSSFKLDNEGESD